MPAGNGRMYEIHAVRKTPTQFIVEKCRKGKPTPYAMRDGDGFARCIAAGSCAYQGDIGEKFPLCVKGYAKAVEEAIKFMKGSD